MKHTVALLLLALGILSSCAGPTWIAGGKRNLTIAVVSPFASAGKTGRALVGLPSETVEVALSGGVEKRQTITLKENDGTYTGTLECPMVPGVTFTIEAIDSAGVTYARAETTVDITDENQTVRATLEPVLPASVPVVTAKVYTADWAAQKAGAVTFVEFAPALTEATDFSATLTNAALAVVRADGSVVARGTNAWSQDVGESVYLVCAKVTDAADLVVGLSGLPKADLPTAGKFYTAWAEGLTQLYIGSRSVDAAGVQTTTNSDGSVVSSGTADSNHMETGSITFTQYTNPSTGYTVNGTVTYADETVDNAPHRVLRGELAITDAAATVHGVQIDYSFVDDFLDGAKTGVLVIDEFSFDTTVLADQVKTTLVKLLHPGTQGALLQAVFGSMSNLQDMAVNASGTVFSNLDGSFTYSFVQLASGMELTYTYTNYLDASTGIILNGTLTQKVEATATSMAYTFNGTLAVSGKASHTMVLAMAMTSDATQSTGSGVLTIDGLDYAFGNLYGVAGPLNGAHVEAYVEPPLQSVLKVYTIAGTGSVISGLTTIGLVNPTGLTATVGSGGAVVYVADTGNNLIKRITLSGSSGTWVPSNLAVTAPRVVGISSAGNLFAGDGTNRMYSAPSFTGATTPLITGTGVAGMVDGGPSVAQFNGPEGAALNPAQTFAYVTDTGNGRIRKVDVTTGDVTTLAATFSAPSGVAVDGIGNIFVSDAATNRIWKIPGETGTPVAVAGATDGSAGYADGTGSAARFNGPRGIALDQHGNLYVADTGNNRIRAITPAGVVTTLGGNGTAGSTDAYTAGGTATFNAPWGVWAFNGQGTFVLFVSDSAGNRIREFVR